MTKRELQHYLTIRYNACLNCHLMYVHHQCKNGSKSEFLSVFIFIQADSDSPAQIVFTALHVSCTQSFTYIHSQIFMNALSVSKLFITPFSFCFCFAFCICCFCFIFKWPAFTAYFGTLLNCTLSIVFFFAYFSFWLYNLSCNSTGQYFCRFYFFTDKEY